MTESFKFHKVSFVIMTKIKPFEQRTRRPSHPGVLLREDVLPEIKHTQGQLAEALGVSRRTINMICTEQRPITPDMAIRLGRFLGNGPGLWLRMQQQRDLWDAMHDSGAHYEKIPTYKAA